VQFFRSLYLGNLFFYALSAIAGLFVLAFFFPALFFLSKVIFGVFSLLVLLDLIAVFSKNSGVFARRSMAEKLSNGSDNEILIFVENRYGFKIAAEIIDELPVQFQKRDTSFAVQVPKGETRVIRFDLRPLKRGSYQFGALNVYVPGPLFLIRKRYRFAQDQEVPVYPSLIQMQQLELLAISNRLTEHGIKKIRRVGASNEFEQIRPYVTGDDQRRVNWKATARKGELMVNNFQDERSQQVYCLIDKGRVMQMPFQGLTLLDYAINASLVVSNIALKKQDKAGLLTFSDKIGQMIPAERKLSHLQKILDVLYNQKTRFLESDFERLYGVVRTRIKQRSLLVLFTNFETLNGAQRQLPYLRRLAKHHLVLVVFFENTELRDLLRKPAENTEAIYLKAIAEKFDYEKRQIVKEFTRHGIQSLLTPPENLSVNTINKYLEFKARGMI
jgi:uncharacterized protein (DUF58 family)